MRVLRYVLFVFLALVCTAATVADAQLAEPKISATEAILIEASTGRVIWEKNADEHRTPASMTKMMTGILALENLTDRTEVQISANAAGTEDVPMGFVQGDLFSAGELEKGLLLLSDNGAAVALAEEMAGSVPAFAEMMNAKAEEIGMEDTHFVNPNGLTEPGHYSTARDMAKLARYAMQNKEFRDIVGTKKAMVSWLLPKNKAILAENTNELLGEYEGATGIKTGWTNAAGGCLAASARRNGIELIAVVMNAPSVDDRFTDARAMLDYGFENVKLAHGVNKDRFTASSWVKGGQAGKVDLSLISDIDFPLIGGEDKRHYKVAYQMPKVLSAPLKAGEPVGKAVLEYNGQDVGSINIIVAKNVPAGSSFLSVLVSWFEPFFQHL